MSLEGFVRASGALLGFARESFGGGGAGVSGGGAAIDVPPEPVQASGRAADAAARESQRVAAHAAALTDQDGLADRQLGEALGAAETGRGRMDSVIAAAVADVAALGVATDTPAGQRALVAALTRHLEETRQALHDGHADAATRAADANVTAAGYRGIGATNAGGWAPVPTMPPMSAVPASGIGSLPLVPLGGLVSLFGPQVGQSAATSAGDGFAQHGATVAAHGPAAGPAGAVVRRALSQLGRPYAWGGGGVNGPGRGDDGSVGFDCSSLVQYAYAGAGVDLPRTTYEQIHVGEPVPRDDIRAGDLVFSNFSGPGVPEHVQLAISPTQVVEAPNRHGHVQVSAVPLGHIVVRRVL